MATQMIPTASMEAHASVLLERAPRWARGVDLKTGIAFVTFSSSRRTKDGQPIYHRTARDGSFCECPGYDWRRICSHTVAVRAEVEQSRERVTRKPTYAELMSTQLVDAF